PLPRRSNRLPALRPLSSISEPSRGSGDARLRPLDAIAVSFVIAFNERSTSTTVVTKWKQRDGVCSDSDAQWLDGRGGKRTSRDGRNERAEVFQAGKRRVGGFRGC